MIIRRTMILAITLELGLVPVVTWAAAQSVNLEENPRADAPVAAIRAKTAKCGTITDSGSYAVKKNLVAEGDCIVVAADYVTIDLGGFTLTGGTLKGGLLPPELTFLAMAVSALEVS